MVNIIFRSKLQSSNFLQFIHIYFLRSQWLSCTHCIPHYSYLIARILALQHSFDQATNHSAVVFSTLCSTNTKPGILLLWSSSCVKSIRTIIGGYNTKTTTKIKIGQTQQNRSFQNPYYVLLYYIYSILNNKYFIKTCCQDSHYHFCHCYRWW